ncbi:MAG: hypothetical protein MUO25_01335 [Thermoanaerobaculaceae bacterium]|nr:hypothetical protein [Thermoanaerobaculaceae bacterium]
MPILQIALALLAGTALSGILAAGGARLRGVLRLPVRPGLRLPVDLLLGSWVLATSVVLLGLARLWFPSLLVGAAAALAAGGRWRRAGWRCELLALPALGALVCLPVALAEPFFYDALVYHLGLPWQALLERGLHAHPEDLFAAFPPLPQLLSAAPLAVGLDRVPAVLHWWSFVAAGAATGGLARSLNAPPWAAGLAALCLPLLPAQVLVPGLPAAEGWAIAGVLASLAVALAPRVPRGGALLAGALAGVASAARLQGIPWSLMVLTVLWLRERRGCTLLWGGAGWLAGSAPWWLKNLVLLGDPTAPILWRREGVETLWRDGGSMLLAGPGTLAHSLGDALAPHAAYLAPLALAAVLAVVSRRQRRLGLAGAVAVGGVLAWVLTGSLPRFLGPTLGVVLALAAAATRTTFGRWAAALALGATAALGVAFGFAELRRLGGDSVLAIQPERVHRVWISNDPFPAFAAARTLPGTARVLFVGEPRGFSFPRRFVAPSQHDVSPLRAILEAAHGPEEAMATLRGQGFTHLLVNQGELARLAGSYPVAPWRGAVGWRRWSAFVSALGLPKVQVGAVQIFALQPGNAPAD